MEVKTTLRKLPFPACVKEALVNVQDICVANIAERTRSIRKTDLAMEIISEFIFCEVDMDRRGGRKKKLTKIEELQLLDVLNDYFTYENEENGNAIKNTVFMSLFPHTHVERCQSLIPLISVAVVVQNISLLTATGVLMQQIGCTSKFSVELAEGLVKDYFELMPACASKLRYLSDKAPLFAANFLTAIAELFFNIDNSDKVRNPPPPLLEIITDWLTGNKGLCFAALTSNLQQSLPHGGIPMPAVTPFAGLFKWCLLAPYFSSNSLSLEHYVKLHELLLECLSECDEHCPLPTQRNVISVQQLSNILTSFIDYTKKNDNLSEESLDFLAQFLQIILDKKCIYGNKVEMFKQLNQMTCEPSLLYFVLKEHKEYTG